MLPHSVSLVPFLTYASAIQMIQVRYLPFETFILKNVLNT